MSGIFDLTGKRALVTGGSRGLGLAMAKGLADAGADLIVTGSDAGRLAGAVEEYRRRGYRVHAEVFDVANEEQVRAAMDRIASEVGAVDILVNNAGIVARAALAEMEVAEFRRVIDIDLVGPFIVAKHVVPQMIKRGSGKIINICSMMSELGRDSVGAYASAKGGLKMLTRSMATEWARYNIQVNGIGPGYFATDATAAIRHDGHPLHEFIIQRTPSGRWGDPADLAGAAVFLASRASDFVNGHILYVDGGILATIGRPADSVAAAPVAVTAPVAAPEVPLPKQ